MSDKHESPSSSVIGINLGRYMTSEVFELIAGDDVRFFVNKDILASQSKPFREATTGPWTEVTERKIDLKDWDSDTVARLVEFLYIRDYTYPDPLPLTPKPASTSRDPTADSPNSVIVIPPDTNSGPDTSRPMTPPGEWLITTTAQASNDSASGPVSDADRLNQFPPAEHEFDDVLLAHAKVYALAHYKGVDLLRTLACKRLHLVLSRLHPLQPASHIAGNIVDFVSYVYANTDTLLNSEEPLRKITAQFVALNLTAFQTEPQAVELVGRGGDFVKDLMSKVCRRLPDPDGFFWSAPRPQKGYISNIKVIYGSIAAPPADRVTEMHGKDCNISYPYNDPYTIWLVPEYTTVAGEACTSFKVLNVASTATQNLDRTHGGQVYLNGVRDSTVLEKITEVALARMPGTTEFNLQAIKEYDGMSLDFRNKAGTEPLYLVWKTVKTRRV